MKAQSTQLDSVHRLILVEEVDHENRPALETAVRAGAMGSARRIRHAPA